MAETVDWASFYRALCACGPQLLLGLDEDESLRAIVAMVAGDTDAFWSDGLQPLLEDGAAGGDVRAGVLAALELWRENVLTALSDEFGIEPARNVVTIDVDSPLVDELVQAAATDD